MNTDKAAIRRALRARRRELLGEAIEAAAIAVATRVLTFGPYAWARTVAAYIATENEVPVDRVIADAWRTGRAVLLPHQGCDGFTPWVEGQALVEGRGGIPQPETARGGLPAPPAIVLVPLVAWDATGGRLGRGGGFYDRVLAVLDPTITRIGIAYEFQEHCRLPRDTWDVPVHYVITERRIVPAAAADARGALADRIQKGGCHRHG